MAVWAKFGGLWCSGPTSLVAAAFGRWLGFDDSRFVRHICAWAGHDTDGKQGRRICDYLVCLT
jgi:hypothetical protein